MCAKLPTAKISKLVVNYKIVGIFFNVESLRFTSLLYALPCKCIASY